MKLTTAFLVLVDGTIYKGLNFGADAPLSDNLDSAPAVRFSGEVVFNTGMTGYHEILTDPSYTGQIVLMTYPHIGNYGTSAEWTESGPEEGRGNPIVKTSGFIVRSLYLGPIPEGRKTLHDFLKENGIVGITDIDTRGLTLKLRDGGSLNGIIVRSNGDVLSETEKNNCLSFLKNMPSMAGQNLIGNVGTMKPEIVNEDGDVTIGVLDCGIKANIIRELTSRGAKVLLFPSTATSEDILKAAPKGILFANGPGDPGVLADQVDLVKSLIGKIPVFGICLGHQLIAQALGGKTFKMKFGHHGVNQPVRDEKTGKVFVTSQNHGFAVDPDSLPDHVDIRFVNANDQSVEGLESTEKNVLCVQFHPEACPGPVDSSWIFNSFVKRAKGV